MQAQAPSFYPAGEARFSDATEATAHPGRASPERRRGSPERLVCRNNGRDLSSLRHRSRQSVDTHDWESASFLPPNVSPDPKPADARPVQRRPSSPHGLRAPQLPRPRSISVGNGLRKGKVSDGPRLTDDELEEALRNQYDDALMDGFGWDASSNGIGGEAVESLKDGFANPLKSALLRGGAGTGRAPVTAVRRPEAAPTTVFRRQKTPTSSMAAIPPQTAINLGRAAAAAEAARAADGGAALPPTPPRTKAGPPGSLSSATESSLMKKKHARLRELCHQRGIIGQASTRDWTKREMVRELIKWRSEKVERGESVPDDVGLVSESESDPSSGSSFESHSFDNSVADDDQHGLDLSYYVHHVGSPSSRPLELNSRPAVASQLAKVEESEEDRFRDAEGDDHHQPCTTPLASDTASLPTSEQSAYTNDSVAQGADTPQGKKTIRAPFQGPFGVANGAKSSRPNGRAATQREEQAAKEWETVRSQFKAARPPLPEDFLQSPVPDSAAASTVSEDSTSPTRGDAKTPRPAEKDAGRRFKRSQTADTTLTSDGSSSRASSQPQSAQQHPPSIPLLDDPSQSRKRRSIRLVGTKVASRGETAPSVVRIGPQAGAGTVSPLTMRGTGEAEARRGAMANLGEMNLLSTAVGPLSPPQSEDAPGTRRSAAAPVNSSYVDSESFGSLVDARSVSESGEDEEKAAGEENLDVLLDLEDLNLADKEIPAEKLTREKKIGSGSFKDVYMGRYRSFAVAICDLRNRLTDLDIKELGLLRDLRHPNIVRFIGVSVGDTIPCTIVTELCRNGDAYNYIRGIPCPPFYQILTMLLDAARGVEYLHTRTPSVVHRDLKSPNLLITSNGTAKITDFGLARVKRDVMSMCATTCGTLNWQAPELWQERPAYNHSIDVYGLGLVFWELLYWPFRDKHYPYQGMNEFAIYQEVGKNGRRPNMIPLRRKWGRDVTSLVERMWAPRPKARPTISEVVRTLNAMVLQERERAWAVPPSA